MNTHRTTEISPADARAALRAACADPYASARAARAAGRKVVGYISHSVPVELIEAAGCFPVMLSGDPTQPTELADRFLDDDFDGATRSLLQQLLAGQCDFLDLLIVPRASNELLHLYYFLLEIARIEPSLPVPRVELFDVLNTPFHSTGVYLQGRITALAATLASLADAPGRPASDGAESAAALDAAALRAAVSSSNATRRRLQTLNALRRQSEPCFSGSDMLLAIRAGGAMDLATHAGLLDALAGAAPEPAVAPQGPRLMIKGAAHDNTAFYDLVEAQGAAIVADDHFSGERVFEKMISEDADPVTALAEHYQLNVPTIRSYPQARQDQRFEELLEEAKVQGVIILHDEFDDTMGWDWPAQKRILEDRGIPYVMLDRQSYHRPDREAQQAAVANLIARIAK
ncbi:2-hydroxyacyl-CoA dehydratase [Pseudoduganella sp. UC29_106]|uniref:2-hydroxyacyl-CoA dehydratase n=1 Tax=Pseudoduganella sp. UC29_106 TaxID=3374553 RepID=UPI003756ABDC